MFAFNDPADRAQHLRKFCPRIQRRRFLMSHLPLCDLLGLDARSHVPRLFERIPSCADRFGLVPLLVRHRQVGPLRLWNFFSHRCCFLSVTNFSLRCLAQFVQPSCYGVHALVDRVALRLVALSVIASYSSCKLLLHHIHEALPQLLILRFEHCKFRPRIQRRRFLVSHLPLCDLFRLNAWSHIPRLFYRIPSGADRFGLVSLPVRDGQVGLLRIWNLLFLRCCLPRLTNLFLRCLAQFVQPSCYGVHALLDRVALRLVALSVIASYSSCKLLLHHIHEALPQLLILRFEHCKFRPRIQRRRFLVSHLPLCDLFRLNAWSHVPRLFYRIPFCADRFGLGPLLVRHGQVDSLLTWNLLFHRCCLLSVTDFPLVFHCEYVVADALGIRRRVQDFLWRIGKDLDPMIDITGVGDWIVTDPQLRADDHAGNFSPELFACVPF